MKTGTMVKDRARRSKRRRRAFWLVVVIVAGTFLNLTRPELIFGPHITPSDELRIRWERVYWESDLEKEMLRLATLTETAGKMASFVRKEGMSESSTDDNLIKSSIDEGLRLMFGYKVPPSFQAEFTFIWSIFNLIPYSIFMEVYYNNAGFPIEVDVSPNIN